MKRILTLVLIVSVLTVCWGCPGRKKAQTKVDPGETTSVKVTVGVNGAEASARVRDLRVYAQQVVSGADVASNLVAEFEASGVLAGNPEAAAYVAEVREGLAEFNRTGQVLLDLVNNLNGLDPTNRKDLRRAYDEAWAAFEKLKPQIKKGAELLAGYLAKRQGKPVDADSLRRHVALGISIVEGAARAIKAQLLR